MSRLRLTFACGIYDRTDALRTGDVSVEGIDLNFLAIEAPREIFDRMGGHQEFDVAGVLQLGIHQPAGARRLSVRGAAGVSVARVFRHGYIYVNRKSDIRGPQELAGKRVGVPLYTMTAAVSGSGAIWSTNTASTCPPSAGSRAPSTNPAGTAIRARRRCSSRPASSTTRRAARCAISWSRARSTPSRDRSAPSRIPTSRRCFPDSRAVERAYYQATHIFPIMHLIVINRDVYEQNPWIGNSLYKGLVDAKAKALARMRKTGAHPYMLPWVHHDIEEINDVFAGDPFPYGVEANRPTLEALVQYMAEQHFISAADPDRRFVRAGIAAGGARVGSARTAHGGTAAGARALPGPWRKHSRCFHS